MLYKLLHTCSILLLFAAAVIFCASAEAHTIAWDKEARLEQTFSKSTERDRPALYCKNQFEIKSKGYCYILIHQRAIDIDSNDREEDNSEEEEDRRVTPSLEHPIA